MIDTLSQDGDDFVLLPHVPDWTERPTYRRRWKQQTETSLLGAQERRNLMDLGLVSLAWRLDPFDPEERGLLVARILAAQKSGLACAPYWGRGGKLAADASTDVVVLEETLWNWLPGDPVFFRSAARSDWPEWEIGEVLAFDPDTFTLTLVDPLSREYPADAFCWPVLFGIFTSEEFGEQTAYHGAISVKIAQRRPWPRPLVEAESEGLGFDAWLDGVPVIVPADEPDAWLDGVPVLEQA